MDDGGTRARGHSASGCAPGNGSRAANALALAQAELRERGLRSGTRLQRGVLRAHLAVSVSHAVQMPGCENHGDCYGASVTGVSGSVPAN